mmetsp:Transcript_16792/g.40933  ORF Transcript_16792/g.40933 Transcript_16792/m.40933 type:complete len:578 (+) Transcript_16792:109-1842(+)
MDKQIVSCVNKLEKEQRDLKAKKIEVLGVRDINRQYELLSHLRALLQERLDRGDVSELPVSVGPSIVEVIRQNSKKEQLMEECTCILYFLSIFDPHFKKGVARLFKSIQDHPGNDSIQKASLAAIRNIVAANRDSLPRISPSIPVILDSMERYSENVDLLSSASEILENLASHTPSKAFFIESGALEQLKTTMRTHMHLGPLQATILRALSNLSFQASVDVRSDMLPIISVVIASMRENPRDAKVQMYGLCTLQNISSATAVANPMHRGPEELVVDNFHTILSIMKVHVEDAGIQEEGMKALYKTMESAPDNRDLMIDEDGVVTIVDAMTRYSHELEIQSQGLAIMLALVTQNADNHELLFSTGGLDVLLAALITFPVNVSVSTYGIQILKDFTRLSLDFQRAVSAKGGIGVIVTAMKKHAYNEDIQDPAFACMRNLCLHQDNREAVKKEGAITVALTNMTHFKANPAIQAYGCDSLGRLATIAMEDIFCNHGIEVALESMSEHPSHAGVQDRACFLLLALSEHRPALKHMKEYNVLPIVQGARVPPKEQAQERKSTLVGRLEGMDRPSLWGALSRK